MSSKTFKITVIAASILAATQANAALYQIVEVTPGNVVANEYYGRAIQKDNLSANPLGCFTAGNSCNTFALGGDTLNGSDGISYRDEVPFKMDNRFVYQDIDDLKSYCSNELGYSTCAAWADKQWHGFEYNNVETGGLKRERDAWDKRYGSYESNASVFTARQVADEFVADKFNAPSQTNISGNQTQLGSENSIITGMLEDNLIGITSSGYADVSGKYALGFRQRAFYDTYLLLPPLKTAENVDVKSIVTKMGRTFAYDSFVHNGKKIITGSSSIADYLSDNNDDKSYVGSVANCVNYAEPQTYQECQNFAFATQAYIWDVTDTSNIKSYRVTKWGKDVEANRSGYSAQASVRGAAIASPTSGRYANNPVMAGFNTYRDENVFRMQATVFYPNDAYTQPANDVWESKIIFGTELKVDGNVIYSNSLATDINNNLIVIGETKRLGTKPESGAAANRIFVSDANSGTPVANYLSGGIFFTGAGGNANAINNFNEIVGQIDAEKGREDGGKQRRHRGFIYPFNGTGSDAARMALFQNQGWWLDDLTNGGAYSQHNNQFRIFEASDINDDGVIAASAFKCTGGYDDFSHNSYCTSGSESVVAIKLIPIAGAAASDIEVRSTELPPVERKGGSMGWITLTLLALFGFRRK
ncbi:MAG: DUF3466 family protein [Vibrio ordalii]|uniref:DUF3466 family protein n=1 Tax=Vibrio ordalii TaxID=28174 RepID=UPI003F2F13AA